MGRASHVAGRPFVQELAAVNEKMLAEGPGSSILNEHNPGKTLIGDQKPTYSIGRKEPLLIAARFSTSVMLKQEASEATEMASSHWRDSAPRSSENVVLTLSPPWKPPNTNNLSSTIPLAWPGKQHQ